MKNLTAKKQKWVVAEEKNGKIILTPRSNLGAISEFKPSKTQQQFKEETNINNIIKRFYRTGELYSTINTAKEVYSDNTKGIKNLQDMQAITLKAKFSFYQLRPEEREKHNNDYRQWIKAKEQEHLNNIEKEKFLKQLEKENELKKQQPTIENVTNNTATE